MPELTTPRAEAILIVGTATMLLFSFAIVGIVYFTNYMQRKWDEEIKELKQRQRRA